jgi:hypothetical protein
VAGSETVTPDAFIAALPPERRELLGHVRALVNANIPPGYDERVGSDMIVWEIPLSRYPKTYNKQPLMFAALASQKNYAALHLLPVYASPERLARLKAGYAAAGVRLDMGKACIRFKRREELAEEALADAISGVTVEAFIDAYERGRAQRQ